MPFKAPRICGCGRAVPWDAQCVCQRERKARHDAGRPSARQRGYDSRWQRESREFLALPANRYCACGCGRIANMVDHVTPHRGNRALFWDKGNWQPMASSPCHSSRKQSIERRS